MTHWIPFTADTTAYTADTTFFTADMTQIAVVDPIPAANQSAVGSSTDVSPFSQFSYQNDHAWQDFVLVNGMAHEKYNTALENAGYEPVNYPLFDVGHTKEDKEAWLQDHYLMHKQLAATVGITEVPDLSDVEVHDDDQFYSWLQLHMQQHQMVDAALNL